MNKGVNMIFEEIVNLPRRSNDDSPSQLSVWVDAIESGDTELEELAMSAMAVTQRTFQGNGRRGPQVTRQEFNETEAQRSERLNMLRRHA